MPESAKRLFESLRALPAAQRIHLAEGDPLANDSDAGDNIYVVEEGRLRLDGARLLDPLEAGHVFQTPGSTGDATVPSVVAEQASVLLRLPRVELEASPDVADAVATLAHEQLRRRTLRPLLEKAFGPLEPALVAELQARCQWLTVRAGQPVFRRNELPDSLYVVASGAVSLVERAGEPDEKSLGEALTGQPLGEEAVLADLPHASDAIARRDSELVSLSVADFEAVLGAKPSTYRSVTRSLLRASPKSVGRKPRREGALIALVPAGPTVDVTDVAARLTAALSPRGKTFHAGHPRSSASSLVRALAGLRENHPRWSGLGAWLDTQAESHRFILLEGEPGATPWTRRIVREADEVVVVADATANPDRAPYEEELLARARRGRTLLLLVHPSGTVAPRGTARWLDAHDVDQHLHVRVDRPDDLARVARWLDHAETGLVLGAGGARGAAHVGVVRALHEAGVVIDQVGGTSVGAMAGAGLAEERSPEALLDLCRAFAKRKVMGDFTFPLTAVLRGKRFEDCIREFFGGRQIEDLWLPFFCTSCDTSVFRDVVHARGPLADALLATTALPGIFPPRLIDGHMHVDGGTTNTLPGNLMRERGIRCLIAVDVSIERQSFAEGPSYPASWSGLLQRFRNPRQRPLLIHQLFMRAVTMVPFNYTDRVREDADLFLRPPVEHFRTGELRKFEEIERIGHDYAAEQLRSFRPKG